MSELMAFIVLSLPLLAILLIVIVAALVARAVARRTEGPEKKKSIAAAIAVVVVILIPTWDEIAGRLYFHYLCITEGGAKINKQVKLPAEYWNPDGTPVFLNARGDLIRSKLSERYVFTPEGDEHFSKIFRIRKLVYPVVERDTGELVGSYVLFSYFGGWLRNYTSLSVAGVGCRNEPIFYARFLRMIFIPDRR